MRKSLLMFIVALMGCILLAGCSNAASTAPERDEKAQESEEGEEKGEEKSEKVRKKKNTGKEKATGESLAKRMAGKYSFDLPDDDPETDEYLIMNVITFGDNLYAYCGQAIKDDGPKKEAYSYWAAEYVPFDADDMKSTDADSVKVNELCFSNMSNAGKYWTSGWEGTIRLTDEGLLFEGFDKEGFLCSEDGKERLFVKDDSVEDIFPYLYGSPKGDDELQGLWISEGRSPHVFLSVNGSDITVFHKPFDGEVTFAEYGCEFGDGSFSGTGNILGNGTAPCVLDVKYSIDGDKLTTNAEGDMLIDEFSDRTIFTRADESDIPVVTVDDLELDPESSGYFEEGDTVSSFEPGEYFGVFIASYKNRDDCIKTEQKLEDAGYYYSPVVYTPDFSKLNPEPYYVVAAGLYDSQQDAEEMLAKVKADGFKDAYVKNAGTYTGDRSWYWLYGDEEIEILKDCVILHDVAVTIPYMTAGDAVKMDLYVDENAVFDESAEMDFFGNYEKGQTPYKWIVKNYNLLTEDPETYSANGPALNGIFEVTLDGDHVRSYYGSYWWD